MEILPEHVRSIFTEAAYKGYERSVRDDLCVKEQNILEKVKLLMKTLQTCDVHVFCVGHYPGFLEGVMQKYNSIIIFYTCLRTNWNDILDPETHLTLFMTGRGDWTLLAEQERSLTGNNRLDHIRCLLKFRDNTQFIVDIGKVTIFQPDLRQNILEIFSHLHNNTSKAALPNKWNMVFRGDKVSGHQLLRCYGTPFPLTWYCARILGII